MSLNADAWKEEKSIETYVGDTVKIRLWEDRTRGEIYTPLYHSEEVVLVTDEYDRSIGENWNIVDSGKRLFEFRAVKPGVHRIVFEKRMGWRFTAEDRRVYILTVKDDPTRDDHHA